MEQLDTTRKGSQYTSFSEETNLLNMLSIEKKKKKTKNKKLLAKPQMPSFRNIKDTLNNLYRTWPYGELVN